MGLITLLLFAAKDSACLKPDVFSLSVHPGWAHKLTPGELIKPPMGRIVDIWKSVDFEDLRAVLLKSSLVHSITDAMKGRRVPFSEGLLLRFALSRTSPHGLCNV